MAKAMEKFLRDELCTSALQSLSAHGGCISNGHSYQTDTGSVFVKHCTESQAQVMFEGERASLQAIAQTHTVRVPTPIKVVHYPAGGGWVFVMEHFNIRGLGSQQATLGNQLARLHLHNTIQFHKVAQDSSRVGAPERVQEMGVVSGGHVTKFGFPCATSCGLLPIENDWMEDWVEFYCQLKLGTQMKWIEEKYGDREVAELWPLLQRKVPAFFEGVEVSPSLLHGDLWSGNAGEDDSGPVVYDPASFYGHHEFDLAIAGMFGGFSAQFYDAYHQLIPRAPGFAARHKLYLLFHYLNHWSHFGGGYRAQSVSLMKELVKSS